LTSTVCDTIETSAKFDLSVWVIAFGSPSSLDKDELDSRLDIGLYVSGGGGRDSGTSAGAMHLTHPSVGEDSVDNVDVDGALLDVFPTERSAGVVLGDNCSTNGIL
jgi:hypothetical protein